MSHDSQPTSIENSFDTPEAQEAYRQDLTNRAIAESIGTINLDMSLDLSREEKISMSDALTKRQEMIGSDQPAVGLKVINSAGGGYGLYGDIGIDRVAEREINDQAAKNAYDEDEQVVFVEGDNGTTTIAYKYNAYTDGSRRPSRINLNFSLSTQTAKEIRNGMASDPSIIDRIAAEQIKALGLGNRTERATSNPGGMDVELGPIKNFKVVGDERQKIIYSRDAAGRPVREESIRYGDKQALVIPAEVQERLGLVTENPVETDDMQEISIEQNILDNEVREEARRMDRLGFTHWEKTVSLWEDRLRTDDTGKVKSYETVYSELMSEPVTSEELLSKRFTDKSKYEQFGETLESYLYGEAAEAVRLMCLDADNRAVAYSIVEAEYGRYSDALLNDELYESYGQTLQDISQALATLADDIDHEIRGLTTSSKFYQVQ